MIEGQYRPSTQKIVDTRAEQNRLEELLEASKPPVPEDCVHLDYQFRTPFRYGRYPGSSRFRREGHTPGVFYAAEAPLTAAIESAWGLVKFYRASPDTPLPNTTTAHTAIQADIRVPISIDLTHPDVADTGDWTHPTDYTATTNFADQVRAEGCEAIRYQSVRDPDRGMNVAVLTCRAFARPIPIALQTWHVFLARSRVVLTNETLHQDHEYQIAGQRFERPV
ncbi:MAG: RES family NAD+ phosphorylase [Silicimonas sp.]|nr:RES family NAD+ phosphorylase [Silicimonas sp.]